MDTVFTVPYEVSSHVDPTQTYEGSVTVFKSVTGVDDDHFSSLPNGFELYQNYPNPFNPSTTISFSLPARSNVSLDIVNVLGQRVDTRQLGSLAAGDHAYDYDAGSLSSGVYFYRVVTDAGVLVRKMVLMK